MRRRNLSGLKWHSARIGPPGRIRAAIQVLSSALIFHIQKSELSGPLLLWVRLKVPMSLALYIANPLPSLLPIA
jgi:hypothetical protein